MTSRDDLSYLRDVAESGRTAPLLGGRFFVWWGGLATVALLAHWYIVGGRAGIDQNMVGFVWLTYGVVGSIGSAVLGRGLRRKPGQGSVGNRGERAVWTAVGVSIFVYAIGTVLANALGGWDADRVILFDTIPLVAFLGYGVSFYVTAALGGPRWMTVLAPIAWLSAGVGLYWTGTATLYLFCAAIAVILAVIPGLLLLRDEPPAEQDADA